MSRMEMGFKRKRIKIVKGYVRGAHASLWFYKYESKVIMIL